MGYKIITGIFVTLTIYILLIHRQNYVMGAVSSPSNLETSPHHHPRNRPVIRFINRGPSSQYPRLKSESFNDFLGT